MNFNAHVLVAHKIESEIGAEADSDFNPLVGLGSALPDLSSIAGCRLVQDPKEPPLRRGVALHHATDRAFHDHPWFLDMQAEMYSELTNAELGRGPARACAHVGIELLVDGFLLRTRPELSSHVEASFRAIPTVSASLAKLTADDKQTRWVSFLARSADWPIPLADHYQPSDVASRLYRILDGRRRLRFDEALIDSVGGVLTTMVNTLEAGIESLLTDVVSDVSDAGVG